MPVRPELHGAAEGSEVEGCAGDRGEHGDRVDAGHLGPGIHNAVDHRRRLVGMRRAGDVGEQAAGGERGERGVEQFGLERGELGNVVGALAPARLGAASQRTETRAGSIQQDAVEDGSIGAPDRAPVDRAHLDVGVDRLQGAPHQARPRGKDLVGDEVRSAEARLRREQGGLAPGARAQIEPALPRRDRPRAGESECGELRALVLNAHAPRGHPWVVPGIAGAGSSPERGVGSLIGCCRVVTRLPPPAEGRRAARGIAEPRQYRERDARRHIICLEQVGEFVGAPLALEGRAQDGDDPDGVSGRDGEPLIGVVDIAQKARRPLLDALLTDAPHHGVDEACRPRETERPGQPHRLVDGGVHGGAHAEQLMRAHAQQIEGGRVDGVELAA